MVINFLFFRFWLNSDVPSRTAQPVGKRNNPLIGGGRRAG
jgi:hypothetical protein